MTNASAPDASLTAAATSPGDCTARPTTRSIPLRTRAEPAQVHQRGVRVADARRASAYPSVVKNSGSRDSLSRAYSTQSQPRLVEVFASRRSPSRVVGST